MKTLATNESITLDQKIDVKRVTKREVEETKEEEIEEGHFYEVFRNSNVQINSQNRASMERIIEQKCGGCNARLMSVKSLNQHTQKCEMVTLNSFFSDLQNLYSMQAQNRISSIEFIHRAFKLIFDTTKNLQRLVRENGINVKAVTSETPTMSGQAEQINQPMSHLKQNNITKSPDNGYASCGSPNYGSGRF